MSRLLWATSLLLSLAAVAACSDDDAGADCATVSAPCDALDETTCDGSAILTCQYDQDGCLAYRQTAVCGASQACAEGECVCSDACTAAESRCAGTVIQTCTADGDGCLHFVDGRDCASDGLRCDDTNGAACVTGTGCGNGVIDGSEVCDGSTLGGQTCLDHGFYGGSLGCASDCGTFDTAGCVGYCGDGVRNGAETCDDGDLGGEICEGLGFAGGTLGCASDCQTLDPAGCQVCLAGQFHCNGNEVQQCQAGPPAQWVPQSPATVCDAASGFSCDAASGTCVDLQPIGQGPANPTGFFLQFSVFTTGGSAFLGGTDVDSFGDYVYVSRGGQYLDVYQIQLSDSDGDGTPEPNQHPDDPNHLGPMEQRSLSFVQTFTSAGDNVPLNAEFLGGELLALADSVLMLGPARNGDISGWSLTTHTATTVADSVADFPLMQLGYGDLDGLFYGMHSNARRVYSFHPGTSSWIAEFEFPALAGGHANGLEVVVDPNTSVQYVYVSDHVVDFVAQYRRDAAGWVQENVFEYSGGAGRAVYGFGFGALSHFWVTDGTVLYELGGGDVQAYLE